VQAVYGIDWSSHCNIVPACNRQVSGEQKPYISVVLAYILNKYWYIY